ncbi:MAG: hypothetical protein JNK79_05580 [Chitinophagaceae bacterium]|nr:hypothetical protein [Chitinophagaceae bacterium]
MHLPRKHINLIIFLTLFTCAASAQVSIRSNINKDAILIGEPISLVVEAYVPTGSDVTWFTVDSIPHFEIVSKEAIDTLQNIDNKKLSQTFGITSFDSGKQYIPPFEVVVNGQPYYTDSVLINVSYTPFDANADYRDIKDIIDVKNPAVDYLHWIILGTAIVMLAIAILLYKKPSKKTTTKQAAPILTPYEEAMQALNKLSLRNVNNGEVKVYYSEMNDILRRYVSRKFEVSTFERTNEELIIEISRLGIDRDVFSRLAESLRISDFVKFARYHPSAEDNKNNLKIVTSSIELLDKNTAGAV